MDKTPEIRKFLEVPYANRYQAAWGEISQRLGARQSIYLQFATATLTAAALVLSLWAKEVLEDAASIGAIALALYSWPFALWIRSNHSMVGLLGAYCKSLEGSLTPSGQAPTTEHAWHTEANGWIVLGRHYGRGSDIAAFLCSLVSTFPALLIGAFQMQKGQVLWAVGLFTAGIIGLGAAFYILDNQRIREQIASLDPEKVKAEADKFRKARKA